VGLDHSLNPANLGPGEPTACLQPYRLQPELGNFVVAFDLNMDGLFAITCVKEKPIRPFPQYRGHSATIPPGV
jgi:hypothetical protein